MPQLLLLLWVFSASVVTANNLRGQGTTSSNATSSTLSNYHGLLAEFKNRNLLRQDYSKTPLQIGLDTLSLTSLQLLPSVFADTATYYLDGVEQSSLPSNVLYSPATTSNGTLWVIGNGNNRMERAFSMDPITGRAAALLPVDLDAGLFAEVDSTDIDPAKLAPFTLLDGDDAPGGRTRSLQELYQERSQQNPLFGSNTLQTCSSYTLIQVAIAYESRFCEAMGGEARANQVVQETVALASLKFQVPGLCHKIVLTHLEGYCNPATDPYYNIFSGSVCTEDDDYSILNQFASYWKNQRNHVQRDVAHLFHGFAHSSGQVGCAWQNGVCDTYWGYGVNELTYGGTDNTHFWGMLFAHELGHSSGAPHEPIGTYSLMDPDLCMGCDQFSDTSIAQILSYLAGVRCLGSNFAQQAPPPYTDTVPPTRPKTVAPSRPKTYAPSRPRTNAPRPNNNNNNGNGSGTTNNNQGSPPIARCATRMENCNTGMTCCGSLSCFNQQVCF